MPKRYLVLISRICVALVGAIVLIAFANVCAYVYLKPALPDVDSLREVQLQVPLRVYTRDGRLIAAIGEQRRIPVRYDQLPPKLIQAFLATEDDRFFRHHGVDWQGILRAALANARAGGIRQGASTITMQVARDMFLTPAPRHEAQDERDLHLVADGERIHQGRDLLPVREQDLPRPARLWRRSGRGGLFRQDPGSAHHRRDWRRWPAYRPLPPRSTRSPTPRRRRLAAPTSWAGCSNCTTSRPRSTKPPRTVPWSRRLHGPSIEVDAPYVAEMVRNELQAKYGDSIYTAGYRVFTTIDSRLEDAATVALRTGLLEYDRRHGWRGATAKVDLVEDHLEPRISDAQLEEFPAVGGLRPAIVQKVEAKSARIYVKELGSVNLPWEKMSWARRELPDEKVDRSPSGAADIFSRGDVIYTVGNSADNTAIRAGAGGAKRACRARSEGRRGGGAGRRLRFLPEQIQPRDPGAAPAGLRIQALRVFGGVRQGIHAGEHRRGCADRYRRGRHGASMAAEGFRERILRADPPARSAGAFAQSGVDTPDARHRRRVHPRATCSASASTSRSCRTI